MTIPATRPSRPQTNPEALRRAAQFPALRAIFTRRSRRFALGAQLSGPLAYRSDADPVPLSDAEEAILVAAATGVTGVARDDWPFTDADGERTGAQQLASFTGRSYPSPLATHGTELFWTNDDGVFFLPQRDVAPTHYRQLTRQDQRHALYRRAVRLADERLDVPRRTPNLFGINHWIANAPGTTLFIPVSDVTRVEQANASQWNASLDIPWSEAHGLGDELEDAACEVFTWLLQQELVAHHVPSSWIPRINPAFLEVKLFLSGKVMDEARHAEVCVKRLWLNGHGPSRTGPASDSFLAPLTQLDDYEQASLLVDVLGEGQILDIFKIVYDLAPEEATRRIVLLSRRDEARHVSYGVARLRHRMETARDPEAVGRQVVEWIADRIAVSDEFFALPENVQAALGVLGREVGIDGRGRARDFPAEANRFRAGRLEAAGLPPGAQRQIHQLLKRA
jgi:hypothetical protein